MTRERRVRQSRYEREFFRDYLEQLERAERMGMHDLTEHYGRYSGGPPDSYEYSERTIAHPHRPVRGGIGFTRPLGPPRRGRGRGPGPRPGPRRRPRGPRPRPRPGPGRAAPGAWDYEFGW